MLKPKPLKKIYRWCGLFLVFFLTICLDIIPVQMDYGDSKPLFSQIITGMKPAFAQHVGTLSTGQQREEGERQEWWKLRSQKRVPLAELSWDNIANDIGNLRQTLGRIGAWYPKGWAGLRKELAAQGAFWLIFIALLAVTQYLLIKGRRYVKKCVGTIDKDLFFFRHLSLYTIYRSLLLAGATLLVYLYLFLASPATALPGFLRFLAAVLMIVLLTKWARCFVTYWFLGQGWITERDDKRLSAMLTGVRYGAILYIFLSGLTGTEGTLPSVLGVFIELSLLVWMLHFWKQFSLNQAARISVSNRWHQVTLTMVKVLSYAVVGGGLVMDLLGYGSFSIYWVASWAASLVIFLWAGMFFMLLREWRRQLKAQVAGAMADESDAGQPFKWVILQLSWLFGFGVLAVLLIMAWGGRQAIMVDIVDVLTYPVSIGEIRFSVMNGINAVIVIVLTHTLVRFWRFVLKEKLLADSGMNVGLQHSITMISVYAVWAFGIMLCLHTFGVGTTTLALAFGALGIGLGFGLQNIFNNFISGIILLFERPIQVGDDIEINGTWATVKKINVRATVVETYDNASIIIPNSEFISSQVTNWSFNDKRLRRSIDVGVAYGSDIEQVRKTMLEIADRTKKVFKQPKPDVIFRDFGDSALVFRLRVWTDIENIFKVETAIRFEIDRLFKEKGIVIAFPQRDVHLFNEEAPQADGAMVLEEKKP